MVSEQKVARDTSIQATKFWYRMFMVFFVFMLLFDRNWLGISVLLLKLMVDSCSWCKSNRSCSISLINLKIWWRFEDSGDDNHFFGVITVFADENPFSGATVTAQTTHSLLFISTSHSLRVLNVWVHSLTGLMNVDFFFLRMRPCSFNYLANENHFNECESL